MGIRAQKKGFTIVCAPEAESLHQIHVVSEHRLSLEVASRRQLAQKHPDVIEDLRNAASSLVPPGGTQFRM
jgi:hypothetical protein